MSTYKLYVQSRGKSIDYEWIDEKSTVCAPLLDDLAGSHLYALCIRKEAGRYHGAMHIYMPGNLDKHGGIIRLEIAIENMSESQARALSIAYLKLPISGDNRIWKKAQETYAPESDGFCTVDIPKLHDIIDEAIKINESRLSKRKPVYKLHLVEPNTHKGGMQEKAIEHLLQYSLTREDGIKIFLNDQIKIDDADLLLLHDAMGTEQNSERQIPLPQPEPDVSAQPKIPCGVDAARDFAAKKLVETGKDIATVVSEPKKNSAWYVIGVAILAVLLLITLIRSLVNSSHQKASNSMIHIRIQNDSHSDRMPLERTIPNSPNGDIDVEVQTAPDESRIMLNGKIIGRGPGKYRIPAHGGILKVLPPNP